MLSAGSVASPKPPAACGRISTIPFSCRIAWNCCNEWGLILSWHCVVSGMPPWQSCFINRGSRTAKMTGNECFGPVTWCHHMWICQGLEMDGTELLSPSAPSLAQLHQVFGLNSRRKRGNGQASVGRADWNDGKSREAASIIIGVCISPHINVSRKKKTDLFIMSLSCNTQFLAFPASKAWSLQVKHWQVYEIHQPSWSEHGANNAKAAGSISEWALCLRVGFDDPCGTPSNSEYLWNFFRNQECLSKCRSDRECISGGGVVAFWFVWVLF